MHHYTDGGLRNVWLANGYEIKKTPHGEGVAFHNLDGLTRSISIPDGQSKFPHPWPPQIPPGSAVKL